MAILSQDQILNADDAKRELVEVPEWGGSVYVRTLKAKDRDSYESSIIGDDGKFDIKKYANATARLAALCMCDETGKRIFDDAKIGALGEKSAEALHRVVQAARKMNKLGEDAVEDAVKNSEAAQGESSISS